MSEALDALIVMAYRQLKRFRRGRARLVSSVVNPIIWIVFFGLGWSNVFNFPMARAIFGGLDYLSFLTPGVVAMSVFTASFIGGITVIWDKQFGFLKEVLVAPAPRWATILGRIIGDSLIAVLQGLIILGLSFLVAHSLNPWGVPASMFYMLILSLAFTGVGVSLALKITSMEAFQMIISFLMLPLVFLSGAFYPLKYMPDWMKIIAYVNPLTYTVDGIRYWLTGVSTFNPLLDLAVLAGLAAIALVAAARLFSKTTLD